MANRSRPRRRCCTRTLSPIPSLWGGSGPRRLSACWVTGQRAGKLGLTSPPGLNPPRLLQMPLRRLRPALRPPRFPITCRRRPHSQREFGAPQRPALAPLSDFIWYPRRQPLPPWPGKGSAFPEHPATTHTRPAAPLLLLSSLPRMPHFLFHPTNLLLMRLAQLKRPSSALPCQPPSPPPSRVLTFKESIPLVPHSGSHDTVARACYIRNLRACSFCANTL